MEIDKKRIFETFFGGPKLPEGVVIITPITKIYKRIKSQYSLIEETKGWWQRMKVKIDSKIVLVLKIPQGFHIKDCFESFDSKKIKKIIFLGFCGSLNENLRIGDIIIPQKKKYKIANTSQIILKKSILRKMKKQGIDTLDMETYFLNEWGERNHVPVTSFLIVTDLPISIPFFSCTKKELRRIDKSIKEVVNKLNYYLTEIA